MTALEAVSPRLARAHARRERKARVLAMRLEAASKAMLEFRGACSDCDERIERDDTRVTLYESMSEYGNWLAHMYRDRTHNSAF